MNNDNLDEYLRFDSLSEAEKLTGKSYKEDENTGFLGMALMIENNKKKNAILDDMGDSKFSNTVDDYLKIATEFGFEIIMNEPFTTQEGINENLYILWHNEFSILLKFDSHTYADDGSWAKAGKEVPSPNVNGGNFYYNIKLSKSARNVTSNGSFNETDGCYIWSGHHDCREGLKHHINNLSENGEFLSQWAYRPFLWLLHHADTKNEGYDYKKINEERIAKLPQHVIDAITPK